MSAYIQYNKQFCNATQQELYAANTKYFTANTACPLCDALSITGIEIPIGQHKKGKQANQVANNI